MEGWSLFWCFVGNAATLSAQKKAADLAACSGRSTRPSAGTQTAPCPNCCMDAAKHTAAARQAASGKSSLPIEVDAQTDSNHDTALTLAAAGGHGRLVSLLLSRGADVEHRDKKGDCLTARYCSSSSSSSRWRRRRSSSSRCSYRFI